MKIRFLKIVLLGMLSVSLLVFSVGKERRKVTAVKAKQIALAKVPGATFANVLEFDMENNEFYKGKINYRNVAYNFEIDVYTGKVINWSEEKSSDK
ncbi:hypothetical protein JCM16776_0843 [Leptotrichia shahii]|jgi:hypothetical protein cdivTM_14329|uniref:PepSY domain-containing protein n=1 Tax=Leptotrichia shahii TaxID=157691 RepID=A0A510JSM0_9FUSO|nr:PepSY domain-containing protein [Leptotrichia shahii]BBM40623.1 hypothetical protein JCM16776_0843 [Leptotrichia shahii]